MFVDSCVWQCGPFSSWLSKVLKGFVEGGPAGRCIAWPVHAPQCILQLDAAAARKSCPRGCSQVCDASHLMLAAQALWAAKAVTHLPHNAPTSRHALHRGRHPCPCHRCFAHALNHPTFLGAVVLWLSRCGTLCATSLRACAVMRTTPPGGLNTLFLAGSCGGSRGGKFVQAVVAAQCGFDGAALLCLLPNLYKAAPVLCVKGLLSMPPCLHCELRLLLVGSRALQHCGYRYSTNCATRVLVHSCRATTTQSLTLPDCELETASCHRHDITADLQKAESCPQGCALLAAAQSAKHKIIKQYIHRAAESLVQTLQANDRHRSSGVPNNGFNGAGQLKAQCGRHLHPPLGRLQPTSAYSRPLLAVVVAG